MKNSSTFEQTLIDQTFRLSIVVTTISIPRIKSRLAFGLQGWTQALYPVRQICLHVRHQ